MHRSAHGTEVNPRVLPARKIRHDRCPVREKTDMKTRRPGAIRIGGGSGFLNDRVDAALELVEKGNIDVLMMETLAERTLALLHVARRKGGRGYWDSLEGRLDVLLPALAKHQTKFVTNAGGAAPPPIARVVPRPARRGGRPLLAPP